MFHNCTCVIQYTQYPDNKKQVWLWPYEALGIIGSELYAITIVCGPKDMSLEKYKHYKHYKGKCKGEILNITNLIFLIPRLLEIEKGRL